MDIKRRWKSLSFKAEHLRLEVEDRNDTIKSFELDFLNELSKLDLEDIISVQQPQPTINVVDQTAIASDAIKEVAAADIVTGPEEIKKLWKTIATLSHPDKTNNDPIKTALYKRAAVAWKSKSYDEIYRVALELGIELPDASEESLEILNGITQDLEKKLNSSATSMLWIWGTTTPEKRLGIIDIYLRSLGKKRKIT